MRRMVPQRGERSDVAALRGREYFSKRGAFMSDKQQWIQEEGTKPGRKLNEVVAVAGLAALLVGIGLVLADPSRGAVGEWPALPSPTFSMYPSGRALCTEAEG